MAYLSFSLDYVPDLSLSKYSSLDENGVDGVLKKTNSFLRPLNRKGIMSKVFFHLIYMYDPEAIKGQRLQILFVASGNEDMLAHTRELIQNSAVSSFYDLISNERVKVEKIEKDGRRLQSITLRNHLNHVSRYHASQVRNAQKVLDLIEYSDEFFTARIKGGTLLSLEDDGAVTESGLIKKEKAYRNVAALGKRDYFVQPSVILPDDNDLKYYKVAEWEMNEEARLYNMFRLMQGLNKPVAYRLDIFSVDYTSRLRSVLPIKELRNRTSLQINKGASTISSNRDENAEETLKQYNDIIEDYESAPHFRANILAFSDEYDIAELIVDSAGAESLVGGSYTIKAISQDGFSDSLNVYSLMDRPVDVAHVDAVSQLKFIPNLYLLEELRPFFTFPALYDGETIEIPKETAPSQNESGLILGVDENGYDVILPIVLLKKHAFLAGVPGSGKTNSMLHIATELWKTYKIPFLILEPAKKEYRALAMIEGMDDLLVFSPSSGTRFPLHINPFEFPQGMSLSEHIRNLMAVFEGAFTLVAPAPFLIDNAIETVYRKKGWYPDTINDDKLPYPTMSELYVKLAEEVEKTDYEGDIKGNLRSILQVRIGSLLRREMGDVFNVSKSTLAPEEWLVNPALIELEAMGTGPANFLTLLLSTLIRESLKVNPSADGKDLRHVMFFEEAHNLIGPKAAEVTGEDADPKLAATAYIVKMLAEVRALSEGIIIADQLPTVMAPEVIKNTGLKIGHRLTAEDDRGLLGSTMSANPTQLEQMATFLPGESLVTFEGLLRPFKTQICQWEGAPNYDSPSNDELVKIMSGKAGYRYLLERSAKICYEKFKTEQKEIERNISLFISDNKSLLSDAGDISEFMEDNNISDEEYRAGNSENPLVKKVQESVAKIIKNKQLLGVRLNDIFSSINELLVKEKGYLYQNKAHKKELMPLLKTLINHRVNLFNNFQDRYSVFIMDFNTFSNEIIQWNLPTLFDDGGTGA